jgi:glycosyltransferase involved in cell wall biosynthesis
MLRVMMLATDLQRGGLPLRLTRLANRLRAVEVEPIVGCLAPPGPLSSWLEAAGIETFACGARGPRDLGCLGRLAEHIRRIRPDVIHSSLFHANLATRLVGRLDRPRPIITSTVTIEIERPWHRWGEALTAGWSDWHVANSEAVAEHVRTDLGFPRQRVVVISNGVDVEELDRAPPIDRGAFGLTDGVPLVAWAGRMDPVKGLKTFVDVIGQVRRSMPVQAVLLGDGPERPRVARWIREAGLDGVIRMALWSEDVPAWLKTADALLFPSRTEGSPNVLLEAMVCGCPVVASALPATRELIDDGVDGLLRGAGRVAEFSEALVRVLADQELRTSIIRKARERVVRRHAMGRVVAEWGDLYMRSIGGGAVGR